MNRSVIEEFEKRSGYLLGRLEKMNQQADAIERLRSGVRIFIECLRFQADKNQITSITSLDQSIASLKESQTTVRQGENIRILTLIAIAYLPLTLVT
ncbi:MAG: hypothetical protein Q9217_006138, partial [Psora testacea]